MNYSIITITIIIIVCKKWIIGSVPLQKTTKKTNTLRLVPFSKLAMMNGVKVLGSETVYINARRN